jgi:NAD(P)-dependent dehydrogenase (short-subunit alcohol dehydrogenase family)
VTGGRLERKIAVITGACGGMGRVACRRFCEEGASVLGVDVEEAAGARLESELLADGLDFTFHPCDVTSSADANAVAMVARERFGGVDILYNNAGAILGKPLVETTDEEWDGVVAVNLRGAFVTMRAIVPLMKGRHASIVNVASGLGLVLLTKAAALELGPAIRVNVLCPGVIDTAMPHRLVDSLPREAGRKLLRTWEANHVAKRLGSPEEVVAVAVFLASDEASFVTGAAIPVDSGVTAA